MSCADSCGDMDCTTCDCAWANDNTCGTDDGTCCNYYCCDRGGGSKSAVWIILLIVGLLILCLCFFWIYLMKWQRGEGFTFTMGARETEYEDEDGNALSANPLYEKQGRWHKVWSKTEEAFYYADEKTGKTQWEKPPGFKEKAGRQHSLSVE